MLTRSEPEELTSRWYVLGDDWQMTLSHKEKLQFTHDPDAAGDDDTPDFEDDDKKDNVRRLVFAAPTGGIA